MNLQKAMVEDFVPFVGTPFSLTDGAELCLIEATLLPQPSYIPGERPPFRLHFTGVPPLLSQGIYPLTHQNLEILNIFIVPIAEDENLFTYEAIFN
jgi:hypothetical protein